MTKIQISTLNSLPNSLPNHMQGIVDHIYETCPLVASCTVDFDFPPGVQYEKDSAFTPFGATRGQIRYQRCEDEGEISIFVWDENGAVFLGPYEYDFIGFTEESPDPVTLDVWASMLDALEAKQKEIIAADPFYTMLERRQNPAAQAILFAGDYHISRAG